MKPGLSARTVYNDELDAAANNGWLPRGQWHTARALESGTVILEMKDGGSP